FTSTIFIVSSHPAPPAILTYISVGEHRTLATSLVRHISSLIAGRRHETVRPARTAPCPCRAHNSRNTVAAPIRRSRGPHHTCGLNHKRRAEELHRCPSRRHARRSRNRQPRRPRRLQLPA